MQYAKRGRLRFTSHRDVSRAIERAIVRAGIPMAYSSGFHPHPRISYAGASPTGAASEAEYVELGLAEVLDPAAVGRELDGALPEGLDVVATVDAATSRPGSLSDLLSGSRWRIETGSGAGLAEAVEAFLAKDSVTVERMTKKGLRSFDCRAAVVTLTVVEDGVLELLLEHAVPAVRPDDVMTGLRESTGWSAEAQPLLTRLDQGTLDRAAAVLADPLATR
ncbi:DUF2344 domain-containing protein [Nocardioides sp. GY 10113]|nr:DUF2344 domain-containing protein [Nocardioides sp. GY 10113]